RAGITPPIGAILVGFSDPERRATHVRDPLYATALVLDDGQTRAAIISCDLIYVHPSVARSVGALVWEQTGIAAGQVFICCSHTHSGPAACDHPGAQPIDRSYVAMLSFLLADAVAEAAAQLEPVRLRWGTARSAVAVNRREMRADGRIVLGHNPSGPVDPLVRVACLDRLESDPPLALLVNYACHPVTLGERSRVVSADYVGHTRTVVEHATGSCMLFLQGACGDINPRFGPGADNGSVQTLGLDLAGAVLAAYAAASLLPTKRGLAAASRTVELPLMEDTSIIPDLISEDERRELCRGIDQWEPWVGELSTDAEGRTVAPIDMQVLRVGDLALVTVPAEPFVEIGLALQEARLGRPTMVAGYTNGCVGYTPMPAAYRLGGYEVARSFVYPRLPAPLAPSCAGRIISAGTQLQAELD
ncbi:MAG: neutral/alkaline non-lysosomal ceramidase N-terminal domain-containing protein, partial [Chloroflexota bacterium]